MEYTLYIQEYYYYLLGFIIGVFFLSFFLYSDRKRTYDIINIVTLALASYTVYYIGYRDVSIGTDTGRYYDAYLFYKNSGEFIVRKDIFYDLFTYLFSFLDFKVFLLVCSFIYVFGAWFGLKKIFKKDYFLPFIFFLITPYFIAWGVNVMRSGIAASLFLVGIGFYYNKASKWKVISFFVLSFLFHLSMMVPFVFLFIARYFKKTKFIFLLWLVSIMVAVLNINVIAKIIPFLGAYADRIEGYVTNFSERDGWSNFITFGIVPVLFAVYSIVILKYKNNFYKLLTNTYMLVHIPYILLLNTNFALRFGYLAEFMMPILLFYPVLINPEIKIRYYGLKLIVLILLVFIIKAFPILMI